MGAAGVSLAWLAETQPEFDRWFASTTALRTWRP
jgi:hypothetical protein